MERKDLAKYYADNVGLIHMTAKKAYARLVAIGASYDYDDLFQDLSLVFVKTYDAFDDNQGSKFSTYFVRSAHNEVNKIIKDMATERIELRTRSVQEMASWSSNDGEEMDDNDLLTSSYTTGEELMVAQTSLNAMMGKLSPLAGRIMALTIDPPEFIEHEFFARATHAKLNRDGGVEKRSPGCINVSFVCSVLDRANLVPSVTLREARQEIARAARESF